MELQEWAQNMQIFVSHINAHQRSSTAEETLQPDGQPASKLSHSVAFKRPIEKWPWWQGSYEWIQQLGVPLIKVDLATANKYSTRQQ